MWLIYLWDGTIYTTSSDYQVEYLEEVYDVQSVTFTDHVQYALDKADYVIE